MNSGQRYVLRTGSAADALYADLITHIVPSERIETIAAETAKAPGNIDDILDSGGTLLLLQSRPVTATGETARATGPVLGAGPVAESFPDPLGPLENDLWVGPLRTGVVAALRETRAGATGRPVGSPVGTTGPGRPPPGCGRPRRRMADR